MKNNLLIYLFLIGATCFVSCETEVPDADSDPPTFSFRITGDGFDHFFTDEDELDNLQLNLRQDASFYMVFQGVDDGGVEQISFRYDTDYIEFIDPDFPPMPWVHSVSGFSSYIEWEGDRNNPLTGNILAGRFRPNGDNASTSFSLTVVDFGGIGNASNTTRGTLNMFIGDFETELIDLTN